MLGPLIVLLPIPTHRRGTRLRLGRKLITGAERYVREYPGPVHVIVPPGNTDGLDTVEVEADSLPFKVDVLPFEGAELRRKLLRAGVVLGWPHHRLHDLPEYLAAHDIPYVLCVEYTLRTRLEIVRAEVKNPVRAARRAAWEIAEELRIRRVLPHVAGLQCNGTPTHEAYGARSDDALLYFDGRVDASMVPSPRAVRARVEANAEGRLRLVYSGRLHPMKGVEHLPEVAGELLRRGVSCELHIFGEGPLEENLRARVRRLGLGDRVHFRGVADFATELVPWVREHADVFSCCHPQGDPSCTYVETLACGVPIAGYANEAFAGILRKAPRVGFAVPIGDHVALAKVVERYSRDRALLVEHSLEALSFASRHLFEETFARRVRQLERLAMNAHRSGQGPAADAA